MTIGEVRLCPQHCLIHLVHVDIRLHGNVLQFHVDWEYVVWLAGVDQMIFPTMRFTSGLCRAVMYSKWRFSPVEVLSSC